MPSARVAPASRSSRVLLADDHTLRLEALVRLLEPELEVVGAVKDGQELVQAAAALRRDVVVADTSMPRLNGIEACLGYHPTTRCQFPTGARRPWGMKPGGVSSEKGSPPPLPRRFER